MLTFEEAVADQKWEIQKRYLLMFIQTGVVGVKKWIRIPFRIRK